MATKVPKRISPNPIVDSVVELRFTNAVPSEAVFGMIFSQLSGEFPEFHNLPVAQLPAEIREKDQNLRFSPTHEARSGGYVFRVGAHVLSLANTPEYFGWDNYSARLKTVLGAVAEAGVVRGFTRLGIRYIDFFELDIFDKVILSITKGGEPFEAEQKAFNALVKNGKFNTNLRIANNKTMSVKAVQMTGSVIDTDTFLGLPDETGSAGLFDLIDECHQAAKDIFFSLLRDDFISTLNPEY